MATVDVLNNPVVSLFDTKLDDPIDALSFHDSEDASTCASQLGEETFFAPTGAPSLEDRVAVVVDESPFELSEEAVAVPPSRSNSYDDYALKKYSVAIEQYIEKMGGRTHLEIMHSHLSDYLRGTHSQDALAGHLRMAVGYLLGHYHGRSGDWGTKNVREDYKAFVHHLRQACQADFNASKPEHVTMQNWMRRFAKVRWFKTEMYSYVKASVEHTLEAYDRKSPDATQEEVPLTGETFSTVFRSTTDKVEHSPSSVRKSKPALMKQQVQGVSGLKDFSGTENTPFVRCSYDLEKGGEVRRVKYHRHSRPTVGGSILRYVTGFVHRLLGIARGSGETIAPDYEMAIEAAKAEGEGIFYVVHQRSNTGVFEIEGESTEVIKELQDRHDNFHVLQQTVEGDFFKWTGPYAHIRTVNGFKRAVIDSFRNGPNSLPKHLQGNEDYLNRVLPQLLDQVHDLFFDGGDVQTVEELQSFLLLFYVFQKDDLKVRLSEAGYPIAHYTTPCKDFLDRGGNMALVEDLVHYYMIEENPDSKDLERTLMTTQGAPLLVKKKQVLSHRLAPGLRVADRLAHLPAQKKEALREVRFGGWRVAAVVHPEENASQASW